MKPNTRGYALLSVIAVITALMIAGIATISFVRSQLHFTADQSAAQAAYYIAEAGVQRGIAQLDNDVATAVTAGYAYPNLGTISFADGQYTTTIAQDTLFPGDYSRKRITSTGTYLGQQATLVAHVLVQAPSDPCTNILLWANRDAYVNMFAAAIDNMFTGDIFANRDVHFVTALAVQAKSGANSHVYAVRNFYSDSGVVLAVPSRMSAELYRGGTYSTSGDLLGLHTTGFHFSNGVNGHGATSPAPTTRTLPTPYWKGAKSRPGVVIVSPATYSTVAAGSSWSGGAGGTWYPGTFTMADNTSYYVDGSVNVQSGQVLQLGGGSSSEIWATGSINIDQFTVLTALATQNLRLVAKGDVRIAGGGLVGLANRTNILAYSYQGSAEVDTAVSASNDTRACIVAGGTNSDATYKSLAGAVSTLKALR